MYFDENTKRTEPLKVPLANGTPTVIAQLSLNNDDLLTIGLQLSGANALSDFDIQGNVYPGEPFVSLRPDSSWSAAKQRIHEISPPTVNPSVLTSSDLARLTVDVTGLAEIKILATASGAGDTLRISISKSDSRFRKSWAYRGQ